MQRLAFANQSKCDKQNGTATIVANANQKVNSSLTQLAPAKSQILENCDASSRNGRLREMSKKNETHGVCAVKQDENENVAAYRARSGGLLLQVYKRIELKHWSEK